MKQLRIVFLGTPDFAVATLDALVTAGHQVVGVITAPDRLGGRGRKQVIESAVKKYAVANSIAILQPTNLKNAQFQKDLAAWKADIQIVVAFRMLPVAVWDMPPLGTYNLHGSLLPAYRGAAPIHWAVINGEETTGVTSFKLKHEIDTGSIAYQESMPIYKNDTTGDVHDRMMILGSQVILKTLDAIQNETLELREQDESKISKAPKIYHDTCEIDVTKSALSIYNFIRGLNPFPQAWMMLWDKKIKVLSATYTYAIHNHEAGTMISDGKSYLAFACNDGYVFLEVIKPEGKGKMEVRNFLNGVRVTPKMSVIQGRSQLLG